MGMYSLAENGTIKMENAGSGGFFDPKLRDRKNVEDDLKNGFISRASAKEVYGYSF
jgi:N-methylhydantoinase B/oxoprolinase/acetone carboxylase alpha subunit